MLSLIMMYKYDPFLQLSPDWFTICQGIVMLSLIGMYKDDPLIHLSPD